jgi:hypothetical protein
MVNRPKKNSIRLYLLQLLENKRRWSFMMSTTRDVVVSKLDKEHVGEKVVV